MSRAKLILLSLLLVAVASWFYLLTRDNFEADVNRLQVALERQVTDVEGSLSQLQSSQIATDKLLDGAVNSNKVAPNSLTADNLAQNAVSSEEIAAGAVTSAKIALNAVFSAQIANGTITTVDIANGAITSDKLADGSVATSKLAADAVVSAKIANGTIVGADIANSTITADKFAPGAVGAASLEDGSVTTAKIADGAVTSAKVASDSLTAANLAANSVGASELADNAVDSASVVDGALTNADINSAAAIALSKLASGTDGQIIVANASGVPTYVSMSGDITIANTGATSIAAGAIVNADINASAAIALSKLASGSDAQIIVANGTGVPTYVAMSGDITIANTGATSIASGAIVNADINASAAIALSKLASGSDGQIIVANGTGVPTYVAMSGDITIANTGATNIAAGAIVNADINSSAAIALSKLASGTDGQIIVANGTGVPTYVAMSGDVTITNTGAANIAAGAIINADINASAAIALSKLASGSDAQLIVANATGVPTYVSMSGDITITNAGATSIAVGAIVNADINASAAIALSKLASGTDGQIIVANGTGVPTYVAMSGDITITNAGVAAIGSGVIVNADINSSAAIALSKLAAGTDGQIIVANGTGVPTYVAMSGDITIANSGATSIASGAIVNADINASAAIALSKLAAGTDGQIIVANGTGVPTYVAMSGDITITNAGATSIAVGAIVNADINSSAAIVLSKLASGSSAQIIVANASGVPTYVAMSGDVTISNTGVATIANGAVTAVKLSTAARTNTVSVQIGDVAAGTATERPIMVAPGNGTVVGVSFTNASAITQSDTNYTTLSVERKTATAATVRSVTTQSTGGVSFAAFAAQRFTTGLSGTTLAAGDVYSFKKADTGTGAAVDEMLVTIEYTVSE